MQEGRTKGFEQEQTEDTEQWQNPGEMGEEEECS